MKTITVETVIEATSREVWDAWTSPAHIMIWNHASLDWECPAAKNDVSVGGRFCITMSAKDGSSSFDFTGTYTEVTPLESLSYALDDGRAVTVSFAEVEGGVKVIETFEMEEENSEDLQRSGWQAILENFKLYVETKK